MTLNAELPKEGLILPGYKISQYGRVLHPNETITIGAKSEQGHYVTQLPRYGHFYVHRLLMSSLGFIKHIDQVVDHIDGNPCNNKLQNLQCVSQSINILRAYKRKYKRTQSKVLVPKDADWRKIYNKNNIYTKWDVCQYGIVRFKGRTTFGTLRYGTRHRVYVDGIAWSVYQLVARYFWPKPLTSNRNTVNHLDNNPSNNHYMNLEWATAREQVLHSLKTNKSRKSCAMAQGKGVYFTKRNDITWRYCDSIRQASKCTGIERTIIENCCTTGKPKNGYIFKICPKKHAPFHDEVFIPLKLYKKRQSGEVRDIYDMLRNEPQKDDCKRRKL